MKSINKAVYFSAIALLSLAGCKKEVLPNATTCEAGGFAADYNRGRTEAGTANTNEYNRGKTNGLALTYAQGLAIGKQNAYNAGYNDPNFGYPRGYNDFYTPGYNAGFASTVAYGNGQNAGAAQGATNGTNDGHQDGEDDGYYDGWDQGYADGYDDGYDDGYWAGGIYAYDHPETCPNYTGGKTNGAARASSGENPHINATECYQKGYNEVLNLTFNYNQGYGDGVAQNTQYQNGITDGNNDIASRDAGRVAGYNAGKTKGYDDGYNKGYQDKYNLGFNNTYTPNYNYYYNIAYNSSYNQYWYYGYDDGYYDDNQGYDDGWDVGYDDGFDDQCWIMGYKTSKFYKTGAELSTSTEITLKHVFNARTKNPEAGKARSVTVNARGAKAASYNTKSVNAARANKTCISAGCSELSRSTMNLKSGSLAIDANNPLVGKGYSAGQSISVNSIRTSRGKEAMVRSIGRVVNKNGRIDDSGYMRMMKRTQSYKPMHQ